MQRFNQSISLLSLTLSLSLCLFLCTGFLADSVETYARQIGVAMAMSATQRAQMQRAARNAAARFSDDAFGVSFARAMSPLM